MLVLCACLCVCACVFVHVCLCACMYVCLLRASSLFTVIDWSSTQKPHTLLFDFFSQFPTFFRPLRLQWYKKTSDSCRGVCMYSVATSSPRMERKPIAGEKMGKEEKGRDGCWFTPQMSWSVRHRERDECRQCRSGNGAILEVFACVHVCVLCVRERERERHCVLVSVSESE